MRSFVVVLLSPVGNNAPGFLPGGKEPAVEAPIAQPTVAALVLPVLPGTAGRNAVGRDMVRVEPGSDRLRKKLRAMVPLHLLWSSTRYKPPRKPQGDSARGERPGA